MQHNTKKRQYGFTAVEIMVTLAILAIIGGVAVSSYGGINRNKPVSALSNDIVKLLARTRMQAMTLGEPVALCPVADIQAQPGDTICQSWDSLTKTKADGKAGWIIFKDSGQNHRIESTADIIDRQVYDDKSHKAVINHVSFHDDIIRFNPKGLYDNAEIKNNGFIIVASPVGDINHRISVDSNTGKISSRYLN